MVSDVCFGNLEKKWWSSFEQVASVQKSGARISSSGTLIAVSLSITPALPIELNIEIAGNFLILIFCKNAESDF